MQIYLNQKQSRSLMKKKIKLSFVTLGSIILAIAFFSPYLYILLSSFKTPDNVISAPPKLWPSVFTFENYTTMFNSLQMGRDFANSMVSSFTSTIICVFLGTLAAYGMSRFYSKIVAVFLVVTICLKMIPFTSIAVPIYGFIRDIGLYDSIVGLIIVYTAVNMPFVIWLMMGFFEGIPKELDEAARVDGCNRFEAFIKIILPVCLPGLSTTAVFTMMNTWNDFLFALMLTSTSAKTVPVAIADFLTSYNIELGPMLSSAILFSLPVLIISYMLQKYIIRGMTLGAIKG